MISDLIISSVCSSATSIAPPDGVARSFFHFHQFASCLHSPSPARRPANIVMHKHAHVLYDEMVDFRPSR